MARQANIQRILDSFLSRIGDQISRGVVEGIAKSGLLKELQIAGTAVKGRGGARRGRRGEPKFCSAEGCGQPARARGLCVRHYQQQRYAEKQAKQAKQAKKKG